MSTLRRRFGRSRPREPSEQLEDPPDTGTGSQTPDSDQVTVVPAKHLHSLREENKRVKGRKRKYAWTFSLGGLFGLLLAGFLASNNDLIDIAALADINIDQIKDILPAGFLHEAKALQVRMPPLRR
jgi:phospholipid:diacylglycerol acyltransferase